MDAASYCTVVEHCMRWIAATDQSMKEYDQLRLCIAHSERKKIYMHVLAE